MHCSEAAVHLTIGMIFWRFGYNPQVKPRIILQLVIIANFLFFTKDYYHAEKADLSENKAMSVVEFAF